MKNNILKKILWLTSIGLITALAFSGCKPKETAQDPEQSDSSSNAGEQPASAPTGYSSPDELMQAYFDALEQGDWDKAQSFIWPYAEEFSGSVGLTVKNLRDMYQNLGFGTLSGGDFTAVSTHDDYVLYDVTYNFSPNSTQDSSALESLTVVETAGGYYISPDNLLCVYELDVDSLNASKAAVPESGTDASEQTQEEPSYAPDEPLDGSEFDDHGSVPMANEELSSDSGVYASVVKAASFANGVFFDVEIDNASDSILNFGTQSGEEAVAVLEGIIISNESNVSADLAKDYNFTLGSETEGAIDSRFDTFAGTFDIAANQKANCEIYFPHDLRMIFTLTFPEIHIGDNTRSLPIDFSHLKAKEGGLSSCAYLLSEE